MAYEWKVIPSFGGGMNLAGHPGTLQDDEWTWTTGWMPIMGTAEVMAAYAELNDGSWLPATNEAIGVVADISGTLGANYGEVLVLCRNTSTSIVRAFNVNTSGTATERTATGTAPTAPAPLTSTQPNTLLYPYKMLGIQVMPCGVRATTALTLLRYDGTNITRILPTSGSDLQGLALIVHQNRLIAGYSSDPDEVRISDAGTLDEWTPGIANTSDEFNLGSSDITAMVPSGNGALIVTSTGVFGLQSTGGADPPYTLEHIHGSGYPIAGWAHHTPHGVLYAAGRHLYLNGSIWPPGEKMWPLILNTDEARQKMLYDSVRDEIIVRTSTAVFRCNMTTGAWHRYAEPVTSVFDHTVIPGGRHWVLGSDASLWIYKDAQLDSNPTALSQAVVYSKDFVFGSPARTVYLERVRVDWEPLSDASTDAVEVFVGVRHDYSKSILGSRYFESSGNGGLASVGTLTAGTSELPINKRGKIVRIGFRQSSGRVRIRGFAFRYSVGADKKDQ